ncbi:hypothetical protein F5Y19DRAFT_489081 [Xylariaceae sp. FL1651]|nr:hypothetical protein F5Y19DRAFT_489081 [Xylariaceae sp. FL1651]
MDALQLIEAPVLQAPVPQASFLQAPFLQMPFRNQTASQLDITGRILVLYWPDLGSDTGDVVFFPPGVGPQVDIQDFLRNATAKASIIFTSGYIKQILVNSLGQLRTRFHITGLNCPNVFNGFVGSFFNHLLFEELRIGYGPMENPQQLSMTLLQAACGLYCKWEGVTYLNEELLRNFVDFSNTVGKDTRGYNAPYVSVMIAIIHGWAQLLAHKALIHPRYHVGPMDARDVTYIAALEFADQFIRDIFGGTITFRPKNLNEDNSGLAIQKHSDAGKDYNEDRSFQTHRGWDIEALRNVNPYTSQVGNPVYSLQSAPHIPSPIQKFGPQPSLNEAPNGTGNNGNAVGCANNSGLLYPQQPLSINPQEQYPLMPQNSLLVNTQEPLSLEPQEPFSFEMQEPFSIETQEPFSLGMQEPFSIDTQESFSLDTQEPSPLIPQNPLLVNTQDPIPVDTQEPLPLIPQQPFPHTPPASSSVTTQDSFSVNLQESLSDNPQESFSDNPQQPFPHTPEEQYCINLYSDYDNSFWVHNCLSGE